MCSSLGALEVYVVCMILSIVQVRAPASSLVEPLPSPLPPTKRGSPPSSQLDAIAQQIVGEISHGLCDTVGAVAEAPFERLEPPTTCRRTAFPTIQPVE